MGSIFVNSLNGSVQYYCATACNARCSGILTYKMFDQVFPDLLAE